MNTPACSCDFAHPELRYNPANNGVAWKCAACGNVLSSWIAHDQLPEVNLAALPKWDAPLQSAPQTTLF